MKRIFYETELFYRKETVLGPHNKKGPAGLRKRLHLMFLEHPLPLHKAVLQAKTNTACIPEKDHQTGSGQHYPGFLET